MPGCLSSDTPHALLMIDGVSEWGEPTSLHTDLVYIDGSTERERRSLVLAPVQPAVSTTYSGVPHTGPSQKQVPVKRKRRLWETMSALSQTCRPTSGVQ